MCEKTLKVCCEKRSGISKDPQPANSEVRKDHNTMLIGGNQNWQRIKI